MLFHSSNLNAQIVHLILLCVVSAFVIVPPFFSHVSFAVLCRFVVLIVIVHSSIFVPMVPFCQPSRSPDRGAVEGPRPPALPPPLSPCLLCSLCRCEVPHRGFVEMLAIQLASPASSGPIQKKRWLKNHQTIWNNLHGDSRRPRVPDHFRILPAWSGVPLSGDPGRPFPEFSEVHADATPRACPFPPSTLFARFLVHPFCQVGKSSKLSLSSMPNPTRKFPYSGGWKKSESFYQKSAPFYKKKDNNGECCE